MPEISIAICDDLAADRTNLAKMVHAYAQAHGFSARLHLYSSGERLLAAFQRPEPIHLLFLDIYLPGLSGMETARRIRSAGNPTSIVFVTVSREHGMESFEVQAFDYLVKPFDFQELLARIRAMTRKRTGSRTNQFTVGDVTVDTERRVVTKGGREIPLLAKEYAILEYMVRHKGAVLSREQMEDRIWNYEYAGSSNNIDVYLSRLRKKLEGDGGEKLIHTVRGVGWILRDPEGEEEKG